MILYMRTQRTGVPRLALAGAALIAVLAAWWLSGGASSSGWGSDPAAAGPPTPAAVRAAAVAPPAAPQAMARPAPTAAAPTVAAPPPPMQYVGQWMEGSRLAVVLGHQGRNVVVRVPGRVDDRYEVVSADDRELVLRDLVAGTTQRLALGGGVPAANPAAGTTAAPAPAAAPEVPVMAGPAVRNPTGKLPPPSKRTSDEDEPEN